MTEQQTPQQIRLLICGSRHPDKLGVMESYAKLATERAYCLGWRLLVGDADGIDTVVMQKVVDCKKLENKLIIAQANPVLVVTYATPQSRNFIKSDLILYYSTPTPMNYTQRDRYMVEKSDKVMCIWNGKSTNSGTYKNYLYACELNKQAWLVNEHGKIIEYNNA